METALITLLAAALFSVIGLLAGALFALRSRMDVLGDRMTDGFGVLTGRLDGIDQRLDGIDQRLDGIDQRFDGMEGRLAAHVEFHEPRT